MRIRLFQRLNRKKKKTTKKDKQRFKDISSYDTDAGTLLYIIV